MSPNLIMAAGSLGTAMLVALIQIIAILIRVADRLARIETTLNETHTARMTEAERRIGVLEDNRNSVERWIHEQPTR